MFNRLSVNLLLKSVIATLVAAVAVVLALDAWQSWNRLKTVERIAAVTDASTSMFTALHNLRLDRTTGSRAILGDQQHSSVPEPIQKTWNAEMPALASAITVLHTIDFAERQSYVSELDATTKKLAALHKEATAALQQPKAARRAGLAQEYVTTTTTLIDLLDKTSSRLTRLVKLDDAYIDQLLELKQLAWIVRFASADGCASAGRSAATAVSPASGSAPDAEVATQAARDAAAIGAAARRAAAAQGYAAATASTAAVATVSNDTVAARQRIAGPAAEEAGADDQHAGHRHTSRAAKDQLSPTSATSTKKWPGLAPAICISGAILLSARRTRV